MTITTIEDTEQKKQITRGILEALPDWFGVPASIEEYVRGSDEKPFVCAFDDKSVGFLYLKETGKDTVEIAVMGVLKEYHRRGIGKALFHHAKRIAVEKGYLFMQVKTVKMGLYDDYDQTNRFYLSLGFQEFEVFPTLWDERNPCQIYVMSLK